MLFFAKAKKKRLKIERFCAANRLSGNLAGNVEKAINNKE
jgi:hypothetical protein